MIKYSILIVIIFGSCSSKSSRAPNPEVRIGNQVWMTYNLDVNEFRNGDAIPEVKDDAEWVLAGKLGKPAFCYYENKQSNGEKYGKLYNWYAVFDSRGLAPKGWHIPSDEEWTTLTNYLGGFDVAGAKMKNSVGWKNGGTLNPKGNGDNSSGFTGLPGGFRNYEVNIDGNNGAFNYIGINGYWWSSTSFETNYAWTRGLFSNSGEVDRGRGNEYGYHKGYGYSVRCIKDESSENVLEKLTNEININYVGFWVADPNSSVRYDGNRIIDITISKNGENYLFIFNKSGIELKTMGTVDQSTNIPLFGGEWLVALDVNNADNLFLKGELFHRVK